MQKERKLGGRPWPPLVVTLQGNRCAIADGQNRQEAIRLALADVLQEEERQQEDLRS